MSLRVGMKVVADGHLGVGTIREVTPTAKREWLIVHFYDRRCVDPNVLVHTSAKWVVPIPGQDGLNPNSRLQRKSK